MNVRRMPRRRCRPRPRPALRPPPLRRAARPVRFIGDAGAYWRLLIRGACLLALTLGIYRFWLATDIRRFLWANTEIAGESLEYTGTAIELLLGFLIAIAILVPLNIAFFVAALSAGAIGELITAAGVSRCCAFLGQYAVYRARRYRLTRTVYRGVRFHQTGSAWRYAVCAVVLVGADRAHARPRLSVRAGEPRTLQDAQHLLRQPARPLRRLRLANLFLRGLPMWLLVIGPAGARHRVARSATVDWAAVARRHRRRAATTTTLPSGSKAPSRPLRSPSASPIGGRRRSACCMAVILFPAFQAMMLRWWSSGLRFGELTIRSHLRTGQIYGAYLRFLLYGLLLADRGRRRRRPSAFDRHLACSSPAARSECAEIAGTVGAVVCYVDRHARLLDDLSGHREARALAARRRNRSRSRASRRSNGSRPRARRARRSAKAWPMRSTWAASRWRSGAGIFFDGTTSARHAVDGRRRARRAARPRRGRRAARANGPMTSCEHLSAPDDVLRLGRAGSPVLARLEVRDPALAAAIDELAGTRRPHRHDRAARPPQA